MPNFKSWSVLLSGHLSKPGPAAQLAVCCLDETTEFTYIYSTFLLLSTIVFTTLLSIHIFKIDIAFEFSCVEHHEWSAILLYIKL